MTKFHFVEKSFFVFNFPYTQAITVYLLISPIERMLEMTRGIFRHMDDSPPLNDQRKMSSLT
jgi:hypothetical protein